MLKRRKKDEYGKIDYAKNKDRLQMNAKLIKLLIVGGVICISALLFINFMLPSFKNVITGTTTFVMGAREYAPSLKLREKKNYTNDIAALSTSSKYLGDVYMYGYEIIYGTVGKDTDHSEVTGLFLRNISSGTTTQINVTLENTDILENELNDKYIVFLDSNRDMGSKIKAINRSTGDAFTVKDCKASNPAISLYDKYIVWTERTGTSTDKLYLYDLETKESSTLHIFRNNSAYAFSQAYIDGNTIVFAAESQKDAKNGAIYSLYIGAAETEPYIYETDTYVHDPKTNGRAAAWIDTNGTTSSNLYFTSDVRNNDTRPIQIASGVTQFGIGDTYVAYVKDASIYLYFIATQETYKLLPENEYGVLMSVRGNTITWLNTTYNTRNKDEIKYLVIK